MSIEASRGDTPTAPERDTPESVAEVIRYLSRGICDEEVCMAAEAMLTRYAASLRADRPDARAEGWRPEDVTAALEAALVNPEYDSVTTDYDDPDVAEVLGEFRLSAFIAALLRAEPAPEGECCGNGRFGEPHQCEKQPQPAPAQAVESDDPTDAELALIDWGWNTFKAGLPVATVINDNQPGRNFIAEAEEHTPTLPVGTKLYLSPQPIPAAPAQAVEEAARVGEVVVNILTDDAGFAQGKAIAAEVSGALTSLGLTFRRAHVTRPGEDRRHFALTFLAALGETPHGA